MPSVWTRQPGTAVYTLYATFKISFGLAWCLISYLPRHRRPNSSWTYRQAVCRFVVRSFLDFVAVIEIEQPAHYGPYKDRCFVTLRPAASEVYTDILLCDPNTRPVAIKALWAPAPFPLPRASFAAHPDPAPAIAIEPPAPPPPPPGSHNVVLLHLHGGAYVVGSVRDLDCRHAIASLLETFRAEDPCAHVRAFCPEYCVSSQPGHRFPAALQDAVTAYAHLVHVLGVPPAEIVLSGDSAGGHLALGLLWYAVRHKDLFGGREPGGCLLWSPWPDMALTIEEAIHRPAVQVDYVPERLIAWAHREFLPRGEVLRGIERGRENPYLSPNRTGLATSTPIWVQWGGAEVLVPEITRLIGVQKGVGGGRLGLCEVADAPHDIFVTGPILGWEREKKNAMRSAVRFLKSGSSTTEVISR